MPLQESTDQTWLWLFSLLWRALIGGLWVVFFLKIIAADIPGVFLAAVLLSYAWIMLREDMQEMPKYALLYAVLCGLGFMFEWLPLMNELSGRTTRTTQAKARHVINATTVSDYLVTTTLTSFFDPSQGIIYNAESVSMFLQPCLMAFGCFLAVTAHQENHRFLFALVVEDFQDDTTIVTSSARPMSAQEARLRSVVMDQWFGQDRIPSRGQDNALHFEGSAYKLSQSRSPSPNPGRHR